MRRTIGAGALAALLVASAALAAPKAADPENRPPDWLRKPDASALRAVWPTTALKAGVDGKALISCTVTPSGTLSSCKVVEEKPAGMGFGAAALLLAPSFLMRPAMRDGIAIASSVTIPVNFSGAGFGPARGPDAGAIDALSRRMPVIVIWDAVPSHDQLAQAWPAGAGDAAFGHVVLRCGVKPDGALKACEKISEEPRGRGFIAASRTLLPAFRMRVSGLDAKVIGKIDVNVPIHFTSPEAEIADRLLAKPEWTRQLAPDQVHALFPDKAADAGLTTGRATVECRVGALGQLTGCRALDEAPAGMDFGPAGVRIASVLAVSAWTPDGMPAEGARVRFGVRINNKETVQGAAAQP